MTRSAKARFGQVGDQVRKVKDQVGQGQGQELDNNLLTQIVHNLKQIRFELLLYCNEFEPASSMMK